MAKWIIGIIVVILIVAAALWYMGDLPGMTPSQTASSTATTATTTQTAQTQTNVAQQNGMSGQSDTSDAAFTQDEAAIDTQMQGLNSDNTNVNSSLSDQPVQQSY